MIKNLNLTFTLLLGGLALGTSGISAQTQEGLSIENFTIKAGETKTVSVNKATVEPAQYTGFQFTITPPEGVTLDAVTANEGYSNLQFTSADTGNGGKTVILYGLPTGGSVPTSSITDGIVTLTLTASKDLVDKNTGTLSFSNVIFTGTEVNNTKFTYADTDCTVTFENVPVTDVEITPGGGGGGDDPDDPDNPGGGDGDKNDPYGQDPDNDDPEKPDPNDPNYPKHENNTSDYFELFVGETITFSANVNEGATLTEITWSPTESTTDLGIKINGNSITIAGKAISTEATKFTATSYNGTKTEISVKVVPMPVMSVTVTSPQGDNIDIDDSITLTATVKPSVKYTGSVTLTWSTEDDDLIDLNSSTGEVTGKLAGDATITVSAQSVGEAKTSDIQITVNPIEAESIEIHSTYYDKTTDRNKLKVGEKLVLTATVSPDDTSFPEVEWTVSEGDVISLSTDGEITATALKTGTAIVTATVKATKESANPVQDTFEITVEGTPLYGDANDDSGVDVADAMVVAYYIVDQVADTFSFINADVIPDGTIDVADQQEIINIALGVSTKYRDNQFVGTINSFVSDNRIVADDFTVGNGGMVELGVRLDNAADYISLQADFIIPQGMNITGVEAGSAANGHSILYNVTENNVLKVVLFSLDSKSFASSDSPVFIIKADADRSCGSMEIENVIALSNESDKYELQGEGGTRSDHAGIVDMTAERQNVASGNGFIEVTAEEGDNVRVYDIAGRMMENVVLGGNFARIELPKGIYIVEVNGKPQRVAVK